MELDRERRVYEIVMHAQEKKPAELEIFLDTACQGDADLRHQANKQIEGIKIVMENARQLQMWHKRQK